MVKACLNQKIIKNSNLIKAMKNSVCPKAKVIRRPNFPESRICPNIYRMFRNADWTHDMIIVKWREVTVIQFFRKPNLSEYLSNVPKCGLNTRHDNCEVTWSDTYSIFPKAEFVRICPNIYRMFRSVVPKCGLNTRHYNCEVTLIHLFIWHKRKLCALTNAPPVQSAHTGQWSTLFHAHCSAAQVYVLYPRQFIFALSCRRHHFCRYYNPQSARKDILKNFLCIWW